jgi:tRNA-specific 2-thiouridylase
MTGTGKKVVVAMSGGVDSSVAAALLLREGFEVIGVFMRLGSPAGVVETSDAARDLSGSQDAEHAGRSHKQGCCSVLDAADARKVAAALGISFYVVNFQDEFSRVIDYFVSEYNRGRTPNPCVRCNDWLKFGRLAAYARAVGADYLASGHYARVLPDPITGRKALYRGVDHRKDQSYVLFGMPGDELDRTLLPVGSMEKSEVRRLAQEFNLPVYNKPDSQEICFVPDQDYAALVRRRSPEQFRPGPVALSDGTVVGEHSGHQAFTIGQRKGVGVAMGRPLYVIDIHAGDNRVVLGDRDQLLSGGLVATDVNVTGGGLARGGDAVNCLAKIRYNADPQPARARWDADGSLQVTFNEPQSAVTPGQAVVVYDHDRLLGGGWIERALPAAGNAT